MAKEILLHGSDHIIENPIFGFGNEHNDYGPGFYCTRSEEMAGEWACKKNTDGFVNRYEFETAGLKILDLTSGDYTILTWIAILLQNRTFHMEGVAQEAKEYVIRHFSVDISAYDVVTGYRADDSYFRYAESFVSNTLPLRGLDRALRLGKLGEQVVPISRKAFEQLSFVDAYPVGKAEYYPKFIKRDTAAREDYRSQIQNSRSLLNDIFVLDIIREEMGPNDPRIQRILSE